MNVGDVQSFLNNLAALLKAHKGDKPAAGFEAFCSGLEPFKELPINDFAQFLRDAAEYKRTGIVPVPEGKKGRGARTTAKKTATPKPKPKTKADTDAIRDAATRLQALYDRFADPALTQAVIEAEVNRIDKEFDTEGLKAVARAFGITSGLSSKSAAKGKILNRIVERKDRYERSEAFSAGAKPAAPSAPESAPAPPAVEVVQPDALVEEVKE